VRHKIDPVWRYIRAEILGMARGQSVSAGITVYRSYGISMDEAPVDPDSDRLADRHWLTPVFPLLGRQMTRGDRYRWLQGFRCELCAACW
jgi:hypothetical protein